MFITIHIYYNYGINASTRFVCVTHYVIKYCPTITAFLFVSFHLSVFEPLEASIEIYLPSLQINL